MVSNYKFQISYKSFGTTLKVLNFPSDQLPQEDFNIFVYFQFSLRSPQVDTNGQSEMLKVKRTVNKMALFVCDDQCHRACKLEISQISQLQAFPLQLHFPHMLAHVGKLLPPHS